MIRPSTLSSRVLFTTTQITGHYPNGDTGSGTAFFFRFKVDEQRSLPVLITNKHVVEGVESAIFHVHEGQKDSEGMLNPAEVSFGIHLNSFEARWVKHPGDVDLCAMPFEPLRQEAEAAGKSVFYLPFDDSVIPSSTQLDDLAAMEDIVMIGYPIGLWDSVGNLPLLRRGITATHPASDFCGRPWGVVDIAAFPGSSGSPVVILNQGSYPTQDGVAFGSRLLLLGVLFGGPQYVADGAVQVVDIPTKQMPVMTTSIPSHLGYYVKAREILELKKHMLSVFNLVPEDEVKSA